MKLPHNLLNKPNAVIDMAGFCVYCNSVLLAAIICEEVKKTKTRATHGSVVYKRKLYYWCHRQKLNDPSIYVPATFQPTLL